ncbi:MAG: PilZ domain-containing protein [Candidatus Sulfotelmatobacter sp.]
MQTITAVEQPTPDVLDRRRFPRYRLSTPITVWLPDGSSVRAITLEISESGLSACMSAPLAVGERADLEPVGGGRVHAVVRRQRGTVYGFECLALTEEQLAQVRALCARLPLYGSGTLGI